MSKLKMGIIMLVVLVILFMVFHVFLYSSDDTLSDRIEPDSIVYIGADILDSFAEIAILNVYAVEVSQSLSRNLTDIAMSQTIGEININATYKYQITAGIDLTKVSSDDIIIERVGDFIRVTLTIPWPEVTGIYMLDENYLVHETMFFRNSNATVFFTLEQMDSRVRNLVESRVRQQGFVRQASLAAVEEIENLVQRLGADIAVVKFM